MANCEFARAAAKHIYSGRSLPGISPAPDFAGSQGVCGMLRVAASSAVLSPAARPAQATPPAHRAHQNELHCVAGQPAPAAPAAARGVRPAVRAAIQRGLRCGLPTAAHGASAPHARHPHACQEPARAPDTDDGRALPGGACQSARLTARACSERLLRERRQGGAGALPREVRPGLPCSAFGGPGPCATGCVRCLPADAFGWLWAAHAAGALPRAGRRPSRRR